MTYMRPLAKPTAVIAILISVSAAPALALEHATVGVLTRVNSGARTIVVKTADGAEEVFKFTARTSVGAAKGTEKGAVASYFAGREGTQVLVRYTGEGTKKTAVGVENLGKGSMKVSKGAIIGTDKAAHTVTVKTKDGSENVYHVAQNAAVDTDHGVVTGVEYAPKKGEEVTVHYTESAGKKIAHFIKRR